MNPAMSRSRPHPILIRTLFASTLLFVCQSFATPAEGVAELIKTSGFSGGIVVQLGCENPDLAVAFAERKEFRVQALDRDPSKVEKTRAALRAKGLYGRNSAVPLDGRALPYVGRLINIIVVEDADAVPASELKRVLVPNGSIFQRSGKEWKRTTVPWPDSIAPWTHFLNGPDNNAVTPDREAGIPRSIQWASEPRWGRSHEELASMSAVVTANGRIYYIVDEAPLASVRFLSDWKLVARDAFNGSLLWKRPIPVWNDHLRHFRSGPAHLSRRLVAVADTVYVTADFAGPVLALDGATGTELRSYSGSERTEEILFSDGVLYLVIGTSERQRQGGGLFSRNEPKPAAYRRLAAYDADSGKEMWRNDVTQEDILPLSLAIRGGSAYYQSTLGLVALNAETGKEKWRAARATPERRMAFSAPTLVATDSVVLCADRDTGDKPELQPSYGTIEWGVHGWNENGFARNSPSTLAAYSAADGSELWSQPCQEGYNSPVDVFVIDNIVWVGPGFSGYDLRTGEQVSKIDTKAPRVGMAHHRCYRNKASERFIFTGKSGIEVLSIPEKKWLSNNSWVRGTCQYGIMPANGLLYAPPDACACFLTVKAPGLFAAAPQRDPTGHMPFPKEPVVVKGPAFGKEGERAAPGAGDWPMYRHDPRRSGFASCEIPEFPRLAWSAHVGGRLTQPVSVYGKVFVASTDTHTVHALDAATGKTAWTFTAGGPIDSAPSVCNGALVFGSSDGWIYCVNAGDGELRWRFRAAPQERLVHVYGELESIWPVHGSVLVQNDSVYALAGRSTYLDSGLVLYRLKPETGEQLSRTVLSHLDPDTGEQLTDEAKFNMEGTMSDLLSGDGDQVFLKYFTFDKDGKRTESAEPRLFAIAGLLGEEWFVRSYWTLSSNVAGAGWGGWANTANQNPAGRILCFNDNSVCAYGRATVRSGPVGHMADRYHLSLTDRSPNGQTVDRKGKPKPGKPGPKWADEKALTVRAMVAGATRIATAGPPDLGEKDPEILAFRNNEETLEAFQGQKGCLLRISNLADGHRLSECPLPAVPVFDGMSVANGKLFVALTNGDVVCCGEGEGTPLPDSASEAVKQAGEITLDEPTREISSGGKMPTTLPKLTEPDKSADFAKVNGGKVLGSELGYRVASDKGAICSAVKKLGKPLTGKAVLTVEMQRSPGFLHPAVYENAFLAFGEGTDEAKLVKCGVKFVQGTAVIATGSARGAMALTEKIPMDKTKPLNVRVQVDLTTGQLTMVAGGKTIHYQLKNSPQTITHIGYVTLNAVSDFGEVKVNGE